MNKKGFTLIELLAVIVILAIIALIAVPVILNMIENARKSAAKSSAYGYIDAINNNNELASMKDEDMGSIPDTISDGTKDVSEINIKIKGKKPTSGEVTITNGRVVSADLCINNYMVNYANNEATVGDKCSGPTPPADPVSFADDDWSVIAANTNSSVYNVGDEREIKLDINNDGTDETYHLVIVNKSTPTECSTDGFSQSACGMVLQFKELLNITDDDNKKMNPTSTNIGGWPSCAMYTYLNSTSDSNSIYNKLKAEIGNIIIDTKTVSGHGRTSGETNFISTDKLYLLSLKEVGLDLSDDSALDSSRKLDYYIKYATSEGNDKRQKYMYGTSTRNNWWTRTASSTISDGFSAISNSGADRYDSTAKFGVSPAFRIG